MPAAFALTVFTRDWHPPNHVSFVTIGGTWPKHCVAGTAGAEFALAPPVNAIIIDKGACSDTDAYSGFKGEGTPLTDRLRQAGIVRLLVTGLATDYCVRASVLDALAAGFETWLALDAIAAVNVNAGDETRAILEMRAAGANLTEAGQFAIIGEHHPMPTALLVVDLQRDFLPGGALAVAGGDRVLAPIAKLLTLVDARPSGVKRPSGV